jgi:hypothetical protein
MDIPCVTCGEPWDLDYVLHEAPHEFTRTHGRIDRCPACPPTRKPHLSPEERARFATVAELAELCGDDLDGFAAELEDFGLL